MIVLTYFQLFCSPATTVSNTSNIICFSSNVLMISVMAYIYSLVVEKPFLTNLCEPMQRVVLRHKSGFTLLSLHHNYSRMWGVIHVCVIDFLHSISELFVYNTI